MSASAAGSGWPSRMPRNASKGSVNIPLRPLKQASKMDTLERLFLEAVLRGDKPTVARCLQGPAPVSVNCTDMMGRSAIQIAVDNENIEIVELLLTVPGIVIGDAILYAIQEGVYNIAEMLVDHPSTTKEMLGVDWSQHCGRHAGESAEFSPDISPVILAATSNQFEILQLLLSRGATIERPHQLSCGCDRCRQLVRDDSLRHSLLRINTYRALASPAWICLTSSDPILTAFRLSWELQRLASRENEFKEAFVVLSQQCRKYACDLLDQCRSSEEVIAVLNKSEAADAEPPLPSPQPPAVAAESLSLDRLKLALKFEQKQFVAHSHCQQLLTTIWYDRLPGWRKQPLVVKALMCFGFVLLMPVLALAYIVCPRSRLGQLMRSPFMKFLNHSASFAIFLVLLLIASTDWGAFKRPKERYMVRGPPPDLVESLILWWVLGFVWAEMKQIWEEGFQAYVRQWWNWLDFIMLALYLTTLALRLAAFTLARTGKYGSEPQSRLEWPAMDPTLLSEAVFSIANVFSFARIIFLFQVNEHLGPLQISLGCMVIDIAKFIFIFYLVITSFACGLNQLYFYYTQDLNIRNDGFATLTNSYQTLFWSLFGVTNRRDVIIQSATPSAGSSSGFGEGRTTEVVAELMLLTYHFVAIIVLVNMLIAMMSSSFQNIQNHGDIEWKFARSKLWMGYFDEGCTLPPPFNTIVSPKSVFYAVRSLFRCCGGCGRTGGGHPLSQKSERARASVAEAVKRPTNNGEATVCSSKSVDCRALTYMEVMQRLVSRYIYQTKKAMRQDGVNEDDLLEIKQDISSLRFELREDRRREVQRSTGHLNNIKRDLIRTLSYDCGKMRQATQRAQQQPQSQPQIPFIDEAEEDANEASSSRVPAAAAATPLETPASLGERVEFERMKRDLLGEMRLHLRQEMRAAALDLAAAATAATAASSGGTPKQSETVQDLGGEISPPNPVSPLPAADHLVQNHALSSLNQAPELSGQVMRDPQAGPLERPSQIWHSAGSHVTPQAPARILSARSSVYSQGHRSHVLPKLPALPGRQFQTSSHVTSTGRSGMHFSAAARFQLRADPLAPGVTAAAQGRTGHAGHVSRSRSRLPQQPSEQSQSQQQSRKSRVQTQL